MCVCVCVCWVGEGGEELGVDELQFAAHPYSSVLVVVHTLPTVGDAWRVILKGDIQNYIHAVYANVSLH